MTKFFSLPRIKFAIEHLSEFDSKWVIPPFVFACNRVTTGSPTDISALRGTDGFLSKFFSGALIGLANPSAGGATGSLRPKFRELGKGLLRDAQGNPIADADYVVHQKVKLWGSGYSRNGYEAMVNRDELIKGPKASDWTLTGTFQAAFEAGLPATFRFEELLVWLYAFTGLPDAINSWEELWSHFRTAYLNGDDIPDAYKGRFKISNPATPWPTDFLSDRPENEEFQKALLASSFAEPIQGTRMLAILSRLRELVAAEYQGIPSHQVENLARSIVGGLMSTKRVFLLGDPGTGKSTLARLVRSAFEEAVETDRLYVLSSEITEKTTESTLIGFTGLDGQWIHGTLTAPNAGRVLLHKLDDMKPPQIRNQVNLILLDEANRKDIEGLLARFQGSLDSTAVDPFDASHEVPLGKSGVHKLSPYTYVVMTGNSPRDDEGRVEQSRPFRRRPALILVPNPLAAWIGSTDAASFAEESRKLWARIAPTFPDQAASSRMDSLINLEVATMQTLLGVLIEMNRFRLGVSYGLLKKILMLTASELLLGQTSFAAAVDAALEIGVSALLTSDKQIQSKGLRSSLLSVPNIDALFPRFNAFAQNQIGEISEYGTVDPHF